MRLIPINKTIEENPEFADNPACQETLYMTIEYFKRIGYVLPWIGYYAEKKGTLVGSAAFKDAPVNNTVEIAYGTFESFRQQGIGSEICGVLVQLALKTKPDVRITARTLPEENFSTRILRKNSFEFKGTVNDPEDGDVWEWEYKGTL